MEGSSCSSSHSCVCTASQRCRYQKPLYGVSISIRRLRKLLPSKSSDPWFSRGMQLQRGPVGRSSCLRRTIMQIHGNRWLNESMVNRNSHTDWLLSCHKDRRINRAHVPCNSTSSSFSSKINRRVVRLFLLEIWIVTKPCEFPDVFSASFVTVGPILSLLSRRRNLFVFYGKYVTTFSFVRRIFSRIFRFDSRFLSKTENGTFHE